MVDLLLLCWFWKWGGEGRLPYCTLIIQCDRGVPFPLLMHSFILKILQRYFWLFRLIFQSLCKFWNYEEKEITPSHFPVIICFLAVSFLFFFFFLKDWSLVCTDWGKHKKTSCSEFYRLNCLQQQPAQFWRDILVSLSQILEFLWTLKARDWLKNSKLFQSWVIVFVFNCYGLHPDCSRFPYTKDSNLLEKVIKLRFP